VSDVLQVVDGTARMRALNPNAVFLAGVYLTADEVREMIMQAKEIRANFVTEHCDRIVEIERRPRDCDAKVSAVCRPVDLRDVLE